jgi:hypothetical protein
MVPLTDNPFAVLTTVVAPAILTNACSVLALGTSNRIARVVDRVRFVSDQIMALQEDDPLCHYWEQQIQGLRERARYLFWALRLIYAALGAFALAALVAIIGSAVPGSQMETTFQVAAGIGLFVGALGVCGLSFGCVLMVQEVRIALTQTQEEAEFAMAHHPGCGPDNGSPTFTSKSPSPTRGTSPGL